MSPSLDVPAPPVSRDAKALRSGALRVAIPPQRGVSATCRIWRPRPEFRRLGWNLGFSVAKTPQRASAGVWAVDKLVVFLGML